MKIQTITDPFHAIIVDDLYDQNELASIWDELEFLRPKMIDGDRVTLSSLDNSGKSNKKNRGILLDREYLNNRNLSNILRINRKIFKREILNQESLWFFKEFACNMYYTLVSYYEDSDHYKKHVDHGTATVLTWFYRDPKKFEGGNLLFPEHDFEVEVLNNRCIIFPSVIPHAVSGVSMKSEDMSKGWGRYVMVQFLNQVTQIPV